MDLLVKKLIRKIVLKRNRSPLNTGLTPLSEIRTAVVLIDGSETESQLAASEVKKFFGCKKIEVMTICPTKEDFDWLGRLKRKLRPDEGNFLKADIFISLFSGRNFAVDYESLCSRSVFKAGCCKMPQKTFDLTVTSPEGSVANCQSESFRQLAGILNMIR